MRIIGCISSTVSDLSTRFRNTDRACVVSFCLKTGRNSARFAALLLAGSAASSSDLAALCHRASSSSISTRVVAGIWTAAVNTTIVQEESNRSPAHGTNASGHLTPVQLSVARDLGCTQAAGLRSNQSIHTSWNCLTSRQIGGREIVAGPFRVNGKNLTELLGKRKLGFERNVTR